MKVAFSSQTRSGFTEKVPLSKPICWAYPTTTYESSPLHTSRANPSALITSRNRLLISDSYLTSFQMYRLRKRSITSGIPNGKPDPLFTGRIEGNPKRPIAEGRLIGCRYYFSSHRLAVTPNDLDKLKRKGPFNVGVDISPRTLLR